MTETQPPAPQPSPSGVRTGPLAEGERVTLTDPKGRRHSVVLRAGATYHTTKGGIGHDELIGGPEGRVVRSVGGMEFLVFRPVLNEFMVTMPRGAAVIYPKDAGQIVMWNDIFPGARVLEAGAGSGALSMALLRAIGSGGRLYSYERRQEFADVARRNVDRFFGEPHPAWDLRVGDLGEAIGPEPIDRAILDMLAPWDCIDAVANVLVPGGFLCCYVATATQLGRVMDTLRAHGGFTEPVGREFTSRDWHAEGLAIRPGHATSGHTGFLVFSRRLAPGVEAPMRRRRPAPGAYGPEYLGPRPKGVPTLEEVSRQPAARDAGEPVPRRAARRHAPRDGEPEETQREENAATAGLDDALVGPGSDERARREGNAPLPGSSEPVTERPSSERSFTQEDA